MPTCPNPRRGSKRPSKARRVRWDVAAGSAVTAGISACDAITGALVGQRAGGEHVEALSLLATAGDDGRYAARQLSQLLRFKTPAHVEATYQAEASTSTGWWREPDGLLSTDTSLEGGDQRQSCGRGAGFCTTASRSACARWRVGRPVKCSIWWRQETPVMTTCASGWARTMGKRSRSPASRDCS